MDRKAFEAVLRDPLERFVIWNETRENEWLLGKISAQPHPTLYIQFLNREINNKNNTLPLGKQICFTIVWGGAETLPTVVVGSMFSVGFVCLQGIGFALLD